VAHRDIASRAEVVVCFDGQYGAEARQESDTLYKSNRAQIDLTPLLALPDVKRGLDSIAIPWIELDRFEGDDVIASVAASEHGRQIVIFSSDRDFFQLLDERISIFNQAAQPGRRQVRAEHVLDRFGVTPAQWCDFRALTGDSADAIPGVQGLGPRGAAKLLAGELTLEDLRHSGRLKGVIGARVEKAWADVMRWRAILRLRRDVDVRRPLTGRVSAPLPRPAEMLESLALW
jgi:DNA polymerase-1